MNSPTCQVVSWVLPHFPTSHTPGGTSCWLLNTLNFAPVHLNCSPMFVSLVFVSEQMDIFNRQEGQFANSGVWENSSVIGEGCGADSGPGCDIDQLGKLSNLFVPQFPQRVE